MRIQDYVVRSNEPPLGGRMGTAIATKEQLLSILGEPSWVWKFDPAYPNAEPKGGVTLRWYFRTPRGLAEVRNYWWNRDNEWTVAAAGYLPARYLCRYLRSFGIRAIAGNRSLVMEP